jgi:hypothetical protein
MKIAFVGCGYVFDIYMRTKWAHPELEALPESLRDGATGGTLQAVVDLDLDELASIEPPRGFGRAETDGAVQTATARRSTGAINAAGHKSAHA